MQDMRATNPCSEVEAKFFWCLHCERVHYGIRWSENKWSCPYPGCDGHAVDACAWVKEDWPRCRHPEYPPNPMIGVVYPLYEFVPKNFPE
jgi:hypothetical protein